MASSVKRWIEIEFTSLELGDARLNKRCRSLLQEFTRHSGKTVASSFSNWANIKACYRFLSNSKVCINAMLAPHIDHTLQRIKQHKTVLILQDSTYLDYNDRPKTTGLDLTFRSKLSKNSTGLILHNTLAISSDGLPLGLVDQRFIDRKSFSGNDFKEKRKIRHWNKAVEEKESVRWINVVKKCRLFDFGESTTVHLADRECDMYEFYRDCADLAENHVIRAARNRAINKRYRRELPSVKLFDFLESKRAQGKVVVPIQVNGKRKFREATLSIIYSPVSLPPPPNKTVKKDGTNLPMVSLNAIMAVERNPPKDQEPLLWVLLTNMEVSNLDQAVEKVNWYSKRWNIETFHKVLKSGCAVEKAQLRTADALKNYVVMKSIVAWRLFWLSRLSEALGESTCEEILSRTEWTLLYRKSMKTRSRPKHPPSVAQALTWIAKLGGYIGRATDPPPGVISLWRGWDRLMDIVDDHRDIYG